MLGVLGHKVHNPYFVSLLSAHALPSLCSWQLLGDESKTATVTKETGKQLYHTRSREMVRLPLESRLLTRT